MTRPALLHEFLRETASRWPQRTAIDIPPGSRRTERRALSYEDLDKRSNALARVVAETVTPEECIVVIFLPRASEYLYISQLAALKAAAAFTCIDPVFPDEQVQLILDDAQAIAVLTDAAGAARVRRLSTRATVMDVTASTAATSTLAVTPPGWLSPSRLAYLIYTSGTTGQPKGVMIEHRSIVNLVRGDLETVGVTPGDRVAQCSSPAYDSSVEETWFALAAGATLVVMDEETTRLGPDLVPWLRAEGITMFCPSPTLLRSTGCEDPGHELPDLRLLHPGGEALASDVADRWAKGRRLVNDYGPTEATVTALRGTIAPGEPVSIGRPVPGMHAWVLDSNLDEVPDGMQGELCLGGIGLARGYHNEPELTARRFPNHPRLGRIYRTGDRATLGPDGRFYCHGRIDAQVKIRGYRIELEAIEARLLQCAGVREAVCTVQGEEPHRRLVAFVVTKTGSGGLRTGTLKRALRATLPEYMVPATYGWLERLPRSTSGKLNREALPVLDEPLHEDREQARPPRTAIEEKLARAFADTLKLVGPSSIEDDFFNDLGGNSLAAAVMVSRLRDDPDTARLTVRDLYEARSVEALAIRASDPTRKSPSRPIQVGSHAAIGIPGGGGTVERPRQPQGRPVATSAAQALFLLFAMVLAAPFAYLGTVHLLSSLVLALGLTWAVVLVPVLGTIGTLTYAVASVIVAVLTKRLLIGTYVPCRAPAWGTFHMRNWIVQRAVALVPWRLLELTELQNLVLRALGAKIGRRVHIHRGVNLRLGGWDLLVLGDDVTVGQDASLQLVTLEDGHIVVDRVTIENGATLHVRAGVGANTHVGAAATLTEWSYLPPNARIPDSEQWDGVPARPDGPAPNAPSIDQRSLVLAPGLHGLVLIGGRLAVAYFVLLPLQALALGFAWAHGADASRGLDWLLRRNMSMGAVLVDGALVLGAVPLMLLSQLMAMRLMGRVNPGTIGRWSVAYIRVRLKTEIVESAGRWLCGTLLWPVWLRAAGMRIARGCEISTIIDTIPELVEIGPESFFADGIHLAGPGISRGVVTLAPVHTLHNVFLGNHAVIRGGQRLPSDVLVGVSTVADDRQIRAGSSWFGHPPFELHNREAASCDRRLTHEPTWPRYLNRVIWELLRFSLPAVPALMAIAWFWLLSSAAISVSTVTLLLLVVPALELSALLLPVALVLALKWLLLARVKPGTHPLWSCWCSRWDFLYVAWDFLASFPLTAVEGTLLLNGYLRLMGARLGRRVLLGPGFGHVADPDMLVFADGATVSCLCQAHTFEDRVLKMDYVTVGRGACIGHASLLLYGAHIGDDARVWPHSVVMKRERLLAGLSYAGCPTEPISISEAPRLSAAS